MARRSCVRAIFYFRGDFINHMAWLFTILFNLNSNLSINATFSMQLLCNYWDFSS